MALARARSALGPSRHLAEFRLSGPQVRFFEEQGYVSLDALTTEEEAQELRRSIAALFARSAGKAEGAFADLIAGGDDPGEMSSPQIVNPVNYLPGLHRTRCFQNALSVARQILGEDARCFFDFSILKVPRRGAATPWHQDEAYRDPHFDYNEVTVWVALQEVGIEGGCLHFVPRSHNRAVLDHRSANDDPTSPAVECIGQFDQASAVACPLKIGGCTIHHHRTLHCSGPNLSDAPRFVYIMTFGTTPKPSANRRTFNWLSHKDTLVQKRKRRWLRRGGILVTVWRRLRRGDLTSKAATTYAIQRVLALLRRGL